MADYDNEIDVSFTVTAKIFGNHVASEAEQADLKAKLTSAIENLCIDIVGDVIIKVTDASEAN
jgi:hypothetical protein